MALPAGNTYEKINYSLRPAKSIERKMIAESLVRLSPFGPIKSYRYVGFGSTPFNDFILFHKSLGITDMVSIEHDVENKERFVFNRPYSCIELQFGESNEILADLEWKKKTILWLDYDNRLDASKLEDIGYFSSQAISGNILLVTVTATPEFGPDDPPKNRRPEDAAKYIARLGRQRLTRLGERVGTKKVPTNIVGSDLAEWGFAKVCQRIIANEIAEVLNKVNAARPEEQKLVFKQLYNFHYSDGMKMLTTGGIFFQKKDETKFNQCSFEQELSFIRTGESDYTIEVPKLTFRELRYLDTQLPTTNDAKLAAQLAIPETQLEMYRRLYRYFPTFTEADI